MANISGVSLGPAQVRPEADERVRSLPMTKIESEPMAEDHRVRVGALRREKTRLRLLESAAAGTLLHGSSASFTPRQALATILPTTDFAASYDGNRLIVSRR